MRIPGGAFLTAAMVAAVLLPAQTVLADMPNDLLTGLNLLDYRFNLKKNYLGKGWDFDANAFYGGQTYRFGFADLTLGDASPASVQISAGYTLRGLPSARFSMKTTNPLSYTLKANYGVQDLTATGSVLIDADTTINALGFYDTTLQISNRGKFQTEGFAATDQGTLDFDAGPIVVSGNIYADMLAGITQPFFTATATENPFAKFSQKSVREAGEPLDLTASTLNLANLNSDQVGQFVNSTIVSALLGQEPTSDLFNNALLPDGLLADAPQVQGQNWFEQVPEPAMLGLMTLGLALCRPGRGKAS
jgi:hypothetical protein